MTLFAALLQASAIHFLPPTAHSFSSVLSLVQGNFVTFLSLSLLFPLSLFFSLRVTRVPQNARLSERVDLSVYVLLCAHFTPLSVVVVSIVVFCSSVCIIACPLLYHFFYNSSVSKRPLPTFSTFCLSLFPMLFNGLIFMLFVSIAVLLFVINIYNLPCCLNNAN